MVLFYGARSEQDLTLRQQIEAVAPRLRLKKVYVLENAPEGWTAETGYITVDVLRRHLPPPTRRNFTDSSCTTCHG